MRHLSDFIGCALLGATTSLAIGLVGLSAAADTGSPADVHVSSTIEEVAHVTPYVVDVYGEEKAAVATAMRRAKELGYSPCEPTVKDADVPEGSDIAAWAAWPEMFGHCTIGVLPDLEDPAVPSYVQEVADHEVCHLSTGPLIQVEEADGLTAHMYDPYHEHPSFIDCLIRMEVK